MVLDLQTLDASSKHPSKTWLVGAAAAATPDVVPTTRPISRFSESCQNCCLWICKSHVPFWLKRCYALPWTESSLRFFLCGRSWRLNERTGPENPVSYLRLRNGGIFLSGISTARQQTMNGGDVHLVFECQTHCTDPVRVVLVDLIHLRWGELCFWRGWPCWSENFDLLLIATVHDLWKGKALAGNVAVYWIELVLAGSAVTEGWPLTNAT